MSTDSDYQRERELARRVGVYLPPERESKGLLEEAAQIGWYIIRILAIILVFMVAVVLSSRAPAEAEDGLLVIAIAVTVVAVGLILAMQGHGHDS